VEIRASNINKLSRELFINRKNRVILARSESSIRFPFLRKLAEKNIETDANQLGILLNNFQDEELTIINDMLPGVLTLCKNEWKGDLNPVEIIIEQDKRKNCSLCGQPNNKWVFNIKNSLNGIKMNVGSTCIDEFGGITLKEGKTRKQLEREAERKERLQQLTINFPGIEKQIDNWDALLDDFDVLIPFELEGDYLALGSKLKELYEGYLNSKENTAPNEEIRNINLEKEKLLLAMEEYTKENSEDRYIATRSIVKWLKRKKELQIIEELKKTGYVSFETAPRIHESEFLNKVIEDLNFHFDDLAVEILKVDHETNDKFIIKPDKYSNIYLTCPSKNFLTHFGWVVFGENSNIKLSISNIFRVCKLFNRESYETVVENLRTGFRDSGFSLSLYISDDYDYFMLDEIDVIDLSQDKVFVISLKKFTEEFKFRAFNKSSISNSEIKDYLSYLDKEEYKVYTIKELREKRDIGRSIDKKR
jgi:hypothetical protein